MKPTLFLSLIFLLSSCVKNTTQIIDDASLVCTEQFVTLSLQINGEAPTSFYTLRIATLDTIRIPSYFENYYPIVDDAIVSSLERDRREECVFVGERSTDTIREVFEIKSDGCHVIKVSGPDLID
jgi:hypothetical protein